MKRRRIIIISVGIFLLAMVVVVVWPAKEAEPVVKGQPFSVWKVEGSPDCSLPVLKACLASADEMPRILACYILGEIGASAAGLIPDLEKAARTTLATRRAALAAIRAVRQSSAQPHTQGAPLELEMAAA
jgi:hypothetical protein